MTVNELILALQALPADERELTAVSPEEVFLPDVLPPRICYRSKDGRETDEGQRVVCI